MPTLLLLLPPRYTPDSSAVGGAAVEAGWSVERLASWRAPESLRDRTDLALYAEPLFVAALADQLELAMLEPPFAWLAELPAELRLREVAFSDLATARALDAPRFVKPADDKSFAAQVYATGRELPAPGVLPDRLPVLVQEPVRFELEVRCFVLERRVLAHSAYWRDGRLARAEDGTWPLSADEAEAALGCCRRVLDDPALALPPAVVLDVGRIASRGWAVVELNPAWGAGLYGCDPRAVLRAVERACVPRARLEPADARWVPRRWWNEELE